jgi:hypothetical protein
MVDHSPSAKTMSAGSKDGEGGFQSRGDAFAAVDAGASRDLATAGAQGPYRLALPSIGNGDWTEDLEQGILFNSTKERGNGNRRKAIAVQVAGRA